MATLDKDKVVGLLNQILEQELAGVVRYTHYSLLVFGYHRIPIVAWLREQASESLVHAQQAGEMITHLGAYPSLAISPLLDSHQTDSGKARLTLRVPTTKVRSIGLRRIASRKLIDEALAVLKGRARQSKVLWSRRAQDYQAKINSDDPRVVAEVVRDLGRNAVAGGQSFSERQLYEAALDRLACEVAAVESVDKESAVARITAQTAAAAG